MIYTLTLNPAIDREYRVPALIFNDVLRATEVRNDPGGKGFNVSRMVAQLGGETAAVGFVGGSTGQWLDQALAGHGIKTAFVEIQGETRTNTTVVSDSEERHIKVNESGPTLTASDLERLNERVVDLARADDWWVLAGSLPPGCPDSIYATLIDLLKNAGCHVLLDASRAAFELGCRAGPDWIKPNLDEARDITGHADPQNAAAALLKMGVKHVAISLGREGAVHFSDEETHRIVSPQIEEKNPIGAGDAFVGGLVYQLDQGAAAAEALRWAAACGAAAASLPGTAFGTRDTIENLVGEVAVSSIIGRQTEG